ncbi:MAG: hypothetical protein DYG88_11440 [Chloroflexi bacterium CFX4]|nr:hypothetical protein [Chloroflexi bacterium CFX4]MDL1922988.1 hypothetical protein [Chloroflexi bacterium CFX3]
MATYEAWNKALFDYTLAGVPKGTRVYIPIDNEALTWLADNLQTTLADFGEVVQLQCVDNGVVTFRRVFAEYPNNYMNPPRYFAFLCAMVLAAHLMGENESSSPNDYFTHFNKILGLDISGRPPGLENGAEERLWKDWAFWLRWNGYQPTAEKNGDHYYTYALSQAMLRHLDKNHLWQHFANNSERYANSLGKGELTAQLRADAKLTTTRFSKHLQKLLTIEGKIGATRYDDLADAFAKTFDAWVENGRPRERTITHQTAIPTTIRAGLYRTEDYLSRKVTYYLLPRQPRYIQVTEAIVTYKDEPYQLLPNRSGWFEPLPFPLSLTDIENDLKVSLQVRGIDRIRALTVNATDFWILTPDPDDVGSGIYASWTDHPILGIPFVLLCKPELKPDMETLRAERLLDWSSQTEIDGWIEYSGAMVLSDVWSAVNIGHKELLNQLRPRTYLGIALRGGLRDTKTGAWLVQAGPEVVVNAFAKQVCLTLLDLSDDSIIHTFDSLKHGESAPIKWLQAGDYMLCLQAEGQKYERFVRIIDWGVVQLTSQVAEVGLMIGNTAIIGAFIETGA